MSPVRRSRRVLSPLAALAVSSLLLASACGGGSKEKAADPVASQSSTATASAKPSTAGSAQPSSTTAIPGSPTPVAVPQLSWKGCGNGYQCATMKAPLDYANPNGQKIDIAVTRHVPKNSRGIVIINPGGPGASGVGAVKAGLPYVQKIQNNMTVVGFDPRGTGSSTNVDCGRNLDAFVSTDSSPDNQSEIDQLKAVSNALAQECLDRGGRALLSHITTVDAAKDMDLLRAALGMDKLNYLGFSYGTMLGAIYLELFPSNAGRVILDGVLDPKLTAKQIEVQQSIAFEKALNDLLAQCGARSNCRFKKGNSASVEAEYDRLAAAVDSAPLKGNGGRKLTQALFTLGVAAGLYDKQSGWPAIELGLSAAQKGDGSVLLDLSDSYDDRQDNGTYPTTLAAMYAINCTDRPLDGGLKGLTQTANEIKKQAPRLGPTVVWLDMPCVVWKIPPIDKAHTVKVPASVGPRVVVVGTTRDPATPYENATSLHSQIKGSHLLTYDGDGHTAVGRNGCVNNLVAAYLVDGVQVPENSRC